MPTLSERLETTVSTDADVLIDMKEIERRLSVSRWTVYRWMRVKGFPAPVIAAPNMVRWSSAAVNQWILALADRSRVPAAA